MKSKTKVFTFLLLLLFITIQCFAQIRSINAEIGEKAAKRLHYALIMPVIQTKDFLVSEKSSSDKEQYYDQLKTCAQFIVLDIENDFPVLEILIKIRNDSEIDQSLLENPMLIDGAKNDFLVSRINLMDLETFAETDNVLFVEPSYRANIELNQSASDIQANEVWSCGSSDIDDCINGRNVIVGIIDGKPNRDHITFMDENGNSRFQQYNNTTPDDHGSHVAGIAGGGGDENALNRGIAYGSDLRWFPLGTNLLENVEELISIANGNPLVINYSAGSAYGRRDGTTTLDEALGGLIQGNVIFVKSAGNNSSSTDCFNHYVGNVPSQTGESIEFEFQLVQNSVTAIEIWHESQFDVQVSDSNSNNLTWSEIISFETTGNFDSYPGNTNDYIQVTNSPNGLGVIYIEYGSSDNFFNPGTYHIRLYPNDNNGGHFDAYHNNSNKIGGFINGNNYQTITNPGYCPEVITVAASKKESYGGDWASYSSLGPSRIDDPNTVSKPDITAPGGSKDENAAYIWSASDESNNVWMGMVGTSMAAPHVTGSIALLMENFPQLNADQVKEILQNSASAIPNGNWQGNNTLTVEDQKYWGTGKLNILAAYQSMVGFDYTPLPGNVSELFKSAYNHDLAGLPVEPVVSDWNAPGFYKQKLSNGAIFLNGEDEEAFWLGEGNWEKWLEINSIESSIGLPQTSEQDDSFNNNYPTVFFDRGKIYWDGTEAFVEEFIPDFEADIFAGNVPFKVSFTDKSSFSNSLITGWLWDFGDGYTSTTQNPEHTYFITGSFDITLTVFHYSHGFSISYPDYITVSNNQVISNVADVEYFFNEDPGFGNGTSIPITPAKQIENISLTLDISTLDYGFNHLYVRAKDDLNRWSLTNIKSFYKETVFTTLPNITKVEYFIDEDPGEGEGIEIPVTPSPNIGGIDFIADISEFANGFHHLYVRTKDDRGKWSLTNIKSFYKETVFTNLPNITKVEYFIDEDPGEGEGTEIPVTPSTNIGGIDFIADISEYANGFHHLYVRAKDARGNWSLTNIKSFYKETVFITLPNITKVEYFIDEDPGEGEGIAIPVTPASNIGGISFIADISGYANGFHHLYVRTKDGRENWSLTNIKSFYKETIITDEQNIVKAEYFFNEDPGEGEGIDLPLTPSPNIQGYSFTADLFDLPLGENTLFVRVMDENNRWSLTNMDTVEVQCAMVTVDFGPGDGCATMPMEFIDLSTHVHPLAEYRWDFGDGTPLVVTGLGNYTHTYEAIGEYEVKLVIESREDCIDSITKNVIIHEPPTVYAGADQIICEGDEVILSANYTNGTLSWDHNATNGVAFVPTETTIYTATVESSFGCGPLSDQVVITVIPLPTVFAGNDATGCANEIYVINSAAAENYTSLSWQAVNGSGYFDNGNQLNTVYHPAPSDPVIVTICLSAQPLAPCLIGTADCFDLTLTEPPSVNIQQPLSGSIICASTVVQLLSTVMHSSGILWATSGDGIFANPTQASTSYTPGTMDIANQQVTLCLEAEPLGGCTVPVVACINLNIQADPQITLAPDFWLDCADYDFNSDQWFPYQMSATIENGASFEWSTEGDGYFDNPSNLQANYHLGNSDILNGEVVLSLSASGPEQCNLVVSEQCVLHIPGQLIPISQAGWRGISSYIDNSDRTVPEVLAPVTNSLAIIMDEANKTYNPATGINNIGNWGAVGYRANFTNPQVCLPVYGVPVSDQTFEIVNSTTFLPVLTDVPVAIVDLFNGHLNQIQQIYDWSTFKTWTPANAGFSELKPGYAYSMVTTSSFTIEFPPFSWEPPLSQVSINGKIINEANGNPVGNIEVLVSGESSVLTNAEGIYSAIVPSAWSGTITPAKAEWIFSPSSKSFENVLVNIYDQDFTGISTSCDPGWEFIVTGSYHTISIPLESNPNIFGGPLQADDWIGVFYLDDNGTEQCGGNVQWTGAPGLVIMAYEDDPATAEKDGFAIGETIQWKIYSCSTQETYNAVATYDPYMPDQGMFANWGFSSLVSLNCQLCQELTLLENWNSVSLYVEPSNPDVETLFAPMVNDLIIMRNLNSIYWPEFSINTIGDWNIESGYVMKMSTAHSGASICGLPLSGSSLTLSASENTWHYLPVLSSCPVDINQMFGQEIDNIVIVKDLIGCKVWWPQMEVYSLTELIPGQAYEIKISDDVMLTYPQCTGKQMKQSYPVSNKQTSRWGTIDFSPFTHVISLSELLLSEFPSGCQIGIFNNEGTVLGYSEIISNMTMVMVAVGNDPSTEEIEGFTESEPMHFRIFNPETGHETPLQVTFDESMPNAGYFTNHGLSAIKGIYVTRIDETSLDFSVEVYPNPSTGEFRIISFGDPSSLDWEVLDIHTATLMKGKQQSNQFSIDLSSYPKGIYYLKITNQGMLSVKKLVLQ